MQSYTCVLLINDHKKGNWPLIFLLLDSLSNPSHLWMIVACMSWPTALLGNSPEWTQHRWCKEPLNQSGDTAYCHLALHTTMILHCISIEHSWLACWHFVQRKMWYLCQECIQCPFLTLHSGTHLRSIIYNSWCQRNRQKSNSHWQYEFRTDFLWARRAIFPPIDSFFFLFAKLTLFSPGGVGGRLLRPALALNADNFFKIQPNRIGRIRCCVRNLTSPWQLYAIYYISYKFHCDCLNILEVT